MPAADRDGQPYLPFRTLPSILCTPYSVLYITPYSCANACSSMALRKR